MERKKGVVEICYQVVLIIYKKMHLWKIPVPGRDRVKTDRVVVMRSSQADSSQNGIMQNKSSSHMILKKEETDHAYIENCFGRSLYSKQELARTEKELCKGNHAGCHVWFTDGKYIPKEKISAENRYLRNQAQLQMERNRIYSVSYTHLTLPTNSRV